VDSRSADVGAANTMVRWRDQKIWRPAEADYRTAIATLKTDLSEIKTDLCVIKSDLAAITTEFSDFRTETRANFRSVDEHLAEIKDLIIDRRNGG
jgi:hypothetical protein